MSEFRKDIVSGDWIVMAPERNKRPHGFKEKAKKRVPTPRKDCPFEHPELTGNWPPVHQWPAKGDWKVMLVPNKFPALRHAPECAVEQKEGVHDAIEGIGWHDLVITRDHERNFAHLPLATAVQVLAMMQSRYRDARKDPCLRYLSAFGNWGPSAGASLFHPHYQMLGLPIVPPHVQHALNGSERYYRTHRSCPHCDMIAYERKRKKGIVAEDAAAVALAPFASRQPYAVHIFPKDHQPHFEMAGERTLKSVAALLQKVLLRMEKRLADPDFNFFIHSAPLKDQRTFRHYHWHIEVQPKVNTEAGFELSTGIDINTVSPEEAAKLLR